MANPALLAGSTVYTSASQSLSAMPAVAAAATTPPAMVMMHPEGYKAVSDKPLPDVSFMTPQEWTTFFSIVDALIPAVLPQFKASDPMKQLAIPEDEFYATVDETLAGLTNPPTREKLIEYLSFRTIDDEAFRTECQHLIAAAAPRMQMAQFLGTLKSVNPGLLLQC